MRILVMFDLPMGSKDERKSYVEFRKFLIKNGYSMEQFSVYSRIALGRDALSAHVNRLKDNLPKAGSITVLTLTEKQYVERMVMLGSKNEHDHANDYGSQMTLIF